MKTHVLTAFTLAILSVSPLAMAFNDTMGNWAQYPIERLSSQGIINGYPNGTFRPEGLLTRAEFATILAKATRLSSMSTPNTWTTFVDVQPNFWAASAIQSAAAQGLISGYPGGYYHPNNNITRAEVLTVIAKAAHLTPLSEAESNSVLSQFQDSAMVPAWAKGSVAATIKSGLYVSPSYQNNLFADRLATRADVAAFSDKLMAHLTTDQSVATNPYYTPPAVSTVPSQQQTLPMYAAVSIVPANTQFTAVLATAITSERSQVGDAVVATLDRPLTGSDGRVVAPAGTQLKGTITKLEKAQVAEQSGGVTLNFNQMVLPNQQSIPITAELNTKDGEIDAASTKDRLLSAGGKTVLGAAIGTGLGALLGTTKGGGKVDDYLTRGAIIGGTGGAISSVLNKGKELILLPGDTLQLRLRQAVTINTADMSPQQ